MPHFQLEMSVTVHLKNNIYAQTQEELEPKKPVSRLLRESEPEVQRRPQRETDHSYDRIFNSYS